MASTSKVDFTAIHAEATKVYHCRRILVQSEVTTLLTAGALTKFENFEHRTTNCVIIVIIQYICSAPITCWTYVHVCVCVCVCVCVRVRVRVRGQAYIGV